MPNSYLARFAINADNVPRARDFYAKVFGWEFEPWGPPNFYLIKTGDAPPGGSGGLLQERRELIERYRQIGSLGHGGTAAERTAAAIVDFIEK